MTVYFLATWYVWQPLYQKLMMKERVDDVNDLFHTAVWSNVVLHQ